jgi:hypothetical protein
MQREQVVQRMNAVIVAAYKVVGFAVLLAILGGLASYLAVQGFFLGSRGWVAPMVVSPSDHRVLQLAAKLAEEAVVRDRVAAERRDLAVRVAEADRVIAAERRFQERFRTAVRTERDARAHELAMLEALRPDHERAREEIEGSNRAYAGLARVRGETLRSASLLDQEAWLSLNHQLAEMAHTNLGVARERAELEARLGATGRELGGLAAAEALASQRPDLPPTSARVLDLEQDVVRSRLALARAEAQKKALQDSLAAANEGLERLEELVDSIRASPFLRAARDEMMVAFVPYENASSAEADAPLYRCRVGFVWCKQVGAVRATLPGETTMRHPVRNRELRGLLVEIALEDGRFAREDVLFVGRPPLLF